MKTETAIKKYQHEDVWSPVSVEARHEKSYSANDMIDAYFKGKNAQYEENQKIIKNLIEENLDHSQKVCEEFCDLLKQNGFKCSFVTFRIIDPFNFDAIFAVSKESFLADNFNEAYRMAREMRKKITTKIFNFTFIFMPLTDSLDTEKLLSDGYIMKYEPKP